MAGATATPLGTYEGRPVSVASITLPNIAGGLRDSLALDPRTYHTGDELNLLVRVRVEDIDHKVIKVKGEDSGFYERRHKAAALSGMIVADDIAGPMLDAERARIEEAKGIQRFDFDGNEDPAAE